VKCFERNGSQNTKKIFEHLFFCNGFLADTEKYVTAVMLTCHHRIFRRFFSTFSINKQQQKQVSRESSQLLPTYITKDKTQSTMSSFSYETTDEEETDTFASFQKYSSFRNAYVEKEVDYIKSFVPEHEEWVAQEKVHGCNFSATTK
jgi:hypothetical protein